MIINRENDLKLSIFDSNDTYLAKDDENFPKFHINYDLNISEVLFCRFFYQYFTDDLFFSNSPLDTYGLEKLLHKILSKRSYIEQKRF